MGSPCDDSTNLSHCDTLAGVQSSSAETFPLLMLSGDQQGIPMPPANELDPYLDAAAL
ncbi:MAG: hypothetical protein QM379_02515 [Acidobacteriota bacterium]|nr:hypothetical protein [Acidobacteriota bacterium]